MNFTAALSPHENRLLKGGRKKEGGRSRAKAVREGTERERESVEL